MTIKITTKTAFAKRKQVPTPQNANLFRPCGRNSVIVDVNDYVNDYGSDERLPLVGTALAQGEAKE